MKKNLMMMAAVLFGILIAFASCKDNKKSSNDDDEEEEEATERVEGKRKVKPEALKRIATVEDLDALEDVDLDDVDVSELDMDDIEFSDEDLEDLTPSQAETLLSLALAVASKDLPQDTGQGMQMTSVELDGRDVLFSFLVEQGALGTSMSRFGEALAMPEAKAAMSEALVGSMDEDMRMTLKLVVTAKKNFCFQFVEKGTGDTAKMRLTTAELKKMIH